MTLLPLTNSAAWTAAGWTMLHMTWLGGVLGVVAAMSRFLLRKARPEARYAASLLILGLFAAAPLALFARVYEPRADITPVAAGSVEMAAKPSYSEPETMRLPRLGRSPIAAPPSPVPASPPRWDSLVARLPWLWLIGSTTTLALLGMGLAGVGRMRRSSRPLIDGEVAAMTRRLADSLGMARRVGVAVCDRIASPVLLGVLRPMILLPTAALSGWTTDELEMALLHELAHLRRHDNLTNLLQCVVEALLFFDPVTWWLSSWVRLERELCCDRLVVEKTGRSRAYATLLASLVGVQGRSMAISALAEKPILTRIRKILNREEKPMRLTKPEGFGLIAAALVAGALALGARAGTTGAPDEKAKPSNEAQRKALRAMVKVVSAGKPDSSPRDARDQTLLELASAQFKVGDRESARATIREANRALDPSADPKDYAGMLEALANQARSCEIWREAGEPAMAREGLDRATEALKSLADPKARDAVAKFTREMEGVDESAMDLGDAESVVGLMLSHAATTLAEQRIATGDPGEARDLIRWAAAISKETKGGMKSFVTAGLGGLLARAGDLEGGRSLARRAEREVDSAPAAHRAYAKQFVARTLVECGDLDSGFDFIQAQPAERRESAANKILDAFQEYDPKERSGWLDPAGIKILIGAQGTKPKGSMLGLIGFASRLAMLDDAKVKTRSLAVAATLLAKAGQFPAAIEVLNMIPNLSRRDFPGPADGFYDAVKPAAFAMVAVRMAKAGDKAGAAALLDRSAALANAIKPADEKLIARIVLADAYVEAGDNLAALGVVRESIDLAKSRPEPLRTRVLVMLARTQAKTGDPAGALPLIDAVREYPGVEKAQALLSLAQTYQTNKDDATAKAMARMALECAKVKAPAGFKLGPAMVLKGPGIGRDTFLDPNLELPNGFGGFELTQVTEQGRQIIGDVADSERAARALPEIKIGEGIAAGVLGGRGMALGSLATDLARKGKLDEALRIAATIDNPTDKLWAYQQMARTIGEVERK